MHNHAGTQGHFAGRIIAGRSTLNDVGTKAVQSCMGMLVCRRPLWRTTANCTATNGALLAYGPGLSPRVVYPRETVSASSAAATVGASTETAQQTGCLSDAKVGWKIHIVYAKACVECTMCYSGRDKGRNRSRHRLCTHARGHRRTGHRLRLARHIHAQHQHLCAGTTTYDGTYGGMQCSDTFHCTAKPTTTNVHKTHSTTPPALCFQSSQHDQQMKRGLAKSHGVLRCKACCQSCIKCLVGPHLTIAFSNLLQQKIRCLIHCKCSPGPRTLHMRLGQ